MGEFNSDDHFIYYCGQEFLWRNGVAMIVHKIVWNAVLGWNLKNDKMIHFQGKTFNTTVIQVYAQTSNAEVEHFYEDLQDLWEITPKKDVLHYRDVLFKSRTSRNTCSNRQIWPWSTEWSRENANRVLHREHTSHRKHPLSITQEKTLQIDITWQSIL